MLLRLLVGWVGTVVGAALLDSGIGVVASAVVGWVVTVVVGIGVAVRKDGDGSLPGAADAFVQNVDEDVAG